MPCINGTNYWIPHDELVWADAKCVVTNGAKTTFEFNGSRHELPADVDYSIVDATQKEGVADIATLGAANVASLLETVRVRYGRDEIYTNVGRILIAVNPFKALPITGSPWIRKYRSETGLAPHIYGMARQTFANMMDTANIGRKSQAVLISGESGAGKTESAKLTFNYIAEVGGGHGDSLGIETRVMQVNPILEAFGNAKTLRNDNSSRFGKWTEMAMSGDAKIESASIVDYLLERSRVTNQLPGERNYHIFFMVLKGWGDKLGLRSENDYDYLNGKGMTKSMDDLEEFQEVVKACQDMGLDEAEMEGMWKIVAAILTVGNIRFDPNSDGGGEGSAISNKDQIDKVGELLGLPQSAMDKFAEILVSKDLKIGSEITKKPLTPDQAKVAKNSFAKFLYGSLFTWVVARLNSALQLGKAYHADQFIGVLDIAGFETFETNSLEQLFINLSNEKLQQFFNIYIFKDELADYQKEGIDIGSDFTFNDNKPILDLIEAKVGIFGILDDMVKTRSSTDAQLLNRLKAAHGNHPNFQTPKVVSKIFTVVHYAGPVPYTIDGFIDKNKDEAPDASFLHESELPLMAKLDIEALKKKTVATSFKISLGELMEKLNQAHPHFVRCIKPNHLKTAGVFESPSVNEQLKFSGVMEAISIRKKGFPLRMKFKDFKEMYIAVFPPQVRAKIGKNFNSSPGSTLEDAVNMLAHKEGLDWKGKFAIGNEKIMFKSEVEDVILALRAVAFEEPTRTIQKMFRGYIARRRAKKISSVKAELDEWLTKSALQDGETSFYNSMGDNMDRFSQAQKEVVKIQTLAEELKFQHPLVSRMAEVEIKLKTEAASIELLHAAQSATDFEQLEASLLRAKEAGITGGIAGMVAQKAVVMARKTGQTMEVCCEDFGVATPDDDTTIEAVESLLETERFEIQQMASATSLKSHEEDISMEEEVVVEEQASTSEDPYSRPLAKTFELEFNLQIDPRTIDGAKWRSIVGKGRLNRKGNPGKRRLPGEIYHDLDPLVERNLTHAMFMYDIPAVERCVQDCGAISTELTRKAESLVKKAYQETFVKIKCAEFAAAVKGAEDDPAEYMLTRLSNMQNWATAKGFTELGVAPKEAKKRRITITNDDTLLTDINMDFRLDNCPRVRPLEKRKGLKHSRVPIHTALTILEGDDPYEEDDAIDLFTCILGYMRDKPMSKSVDNKSEVLFICVHKPNLVDECYVQICKQLIGNPDPNSARLGYQLLRSVAEVCAPSPALEPYLRVFVRDSEQCIQDQQLQQDILTSLNDSVEGHPKRTPSMERVGEFQRRMSQTSDARRSILAELNHQDIASVEEPKEDTPQKTVEHDIRSEGSEPVARPGDEQVDVTIDGSCPKTQEAQILEDGLPVNFKPTGFESRLLKNAWKDQEDEFTRQRRVESAKSAAHTAMMEDEQELLLKELQETERLEQESQALVQKAKRDLLKLGSVVLLLSVYLSAVNGEGGVFPLFFCTGVAIMMWLFQNGQGDVVTSGLTEMGCEMSDAFKSTGQKLQERIQRPAPKAKRRNA